MSAEAAALLSGAERGDPTRAGGKAAALARLAAQFPVPPFLVIAPEAFGEGGLDAAVARAVVARLDRLGPGPFAVRSSAREEDGPAAAHAGQFATELDVAADAVAAAAWRVWRSGSRDTVADYRRARGLDAVTRPPAVIVQQMVRARAAGVAFTADPVSGDRRCVVISAVAGLADRLVSGEIDGDQYRVGADGEAGAASITGAAPVLTVDERAAVAALARRAEGHFGTPQDVEWAFDGERLHLLQSRPITALPSPAAVPDDGGLDIWDNSNIVESYPGIVSPLTFSFARYVYAHVYRAFSRMMGVPQAVIADHHAVFENLLGRIDGRVYYNLLNWYRALAQFPGFTANRAFMEGMMGAEALPAALAARIAPRPASGIARWWDRARLARVGVGLAWQQLRLQRSILRFQRRLDEALAAPDAAIDEMPATRLAAEYRRLERRLLARWDAPLINDFLCMIAFGASRRVLEKWCGSGGLAAHADMLIGQGDIISAEPARRIREMGRLAAAQPEVVEALARGERDAVTAIPALAEAFAGYVRKFGDRCTQELKLESLTLHDDPGPLLRAVAAAARATPRPDAAASARTAPLDAVLAGRPLRRLVAGRLVAWARARVRDRENLRFERTRLFGRVRRIFLALGRRLEGAGLIAGTRDVFNLTVEEVLGAVEGTVTTEDLSALARLRQREMDTFAARPDPPPRHEIRGGLLLGRRSGADAAKPAADGDTRRGLACCQGVVTATVRVIEDPRLQTLQPGEILVARHTDPGWIAAFAAAAGVIAERGSLLSHSAIVAREMGVPCVVALKDATRWLRTGDTVRLDGATGVVARIGDGKRDG